MIPRDYASHYGRDFKIALIISLCIVISLFYFIQPSKSASTKFTSSGETLFSSNDVPPTVQTPEELRAASAIPKRPEIYIPDISSQPELLPDVKVGGESSATSSGQAGTKSSVPSELTADQLPFVPRQILEVVPKKNSGEANGTIKLSLKIGINGEVESYIVLVNTTNCDECLNNVINAVKKSRWEPAVVNGKKIQYWIEKSYIFN